MIYTCPSCHRVIDDADYIHVFCACCTTEMLKTDSINSGGVRRFDVNNSNFKSPLLLASSQNSADCEVERSDCIEVSYARL